MLDGASLRISEFIKYLKRLNKALYSVAYGATAYPVTLDPRIAVILGKNAEAVTKNLHAAGKIKLYRQISTRGIYARKSYIVEFYDM